MIRNPMLAFQEQMERTLFPFRSAFANMERINRALTSPIADTFARMGAITQALTHVGITGHAAAFVTAIESLRHFGIISHTNAFGAAIQAVQQLPEFSAGMQAVTRFSAIGSELYSMREIPALQNALRGIEYSLSASRVFEALGASHALDLIGSMPSLGSILGQVMAEGLQERLAALAEIDIEQLHEDLAGEHTEELSAVDVEAAEGLFNETGFPNLSLEAQITGIYAMLEKLANEKDKPESTKTAIILKWFLVTVATSLASFILTKCCEYVYNHVPPAAIVRNARKAYNSLTVNRAELRTSRLVARPALHARSSYRKHSQPLAILPVGLMVRILKRRKRWALVEWQDTDTGEIIKGWVRHKYLRRLLRNR